MRHPSRRTSTILLVLAAVACFGVVCTYGFTNAEDQGLITRNPMFNPPTFSTLRAIWTGPHLYLYVPVTYTAWWLLAHVAQTSTADETGATLNPWVFHSANLLAHVVASLLVLALLRRLTRREGPALVGAVLFAIHPLQTEAVAWTTGMKDTLCGVFAFAALLMYERHAQRHSRVTRPCHAEGRGSDPRDLEVQPASGDEAPVILRYSEGSGTERRGTQILREYAQDDSLAARPAHDDAEVARVATAPLGMTYALATGFLVLALLAKPAAVVVPVMALVIDRLLLGRTWGAIARSLALWFVLIVPVMLVARHVQPAAEVTPAPLWARPLVAGDALAFYLGKLVWPVGLSVNYGRSPDAILRSGALYWTWLVPAALAAALAWRWRRGERWLPAAALLFAAGVLPVLGLTTFLYQQFSTVADRFVYLSMFGPALAAAWVMSRRWNRGAAALAAVVLIVLGARTASQARVWRDRLTLLAHAVAVTPDYPVARRAYAGALLEENRIAEAIVQLEHVMRVAPDETTRELVSQLRAATTRNVEPRMNADERR
jgi:hypothetical protein